jgi:hypothetical protein
VHSLFELCSTTRETVFSARKKTTELSNILSKMQRHRLNDVQEKAAVARLAAAAAKPN